MAIPTLTPASVVSAVALPSGSVNYAEVDTLVPYRVYSDTSSPLFDKNFATGAVEQVSYVYKKLGGDILDLELTKGTVFTSYEEACLEYSYIVNIHQATNVLSDALGATTGTFDHKGHIKDFEGTTPLASASGSHVALMYPKFNFAYSKKISMGVSAEVGMMGGTEFSASFFTTSSVQDYDLQKIVEHAAETNPSVNFYKKVRNKKIVVKQVYYKTAHAMWRFYGYYGGLNVVGNLHNYGQFSDDSTFQLVPTWHNKAQALAYEDAIYTRMSHFSYELKDNKLRLFPPPMHFNAAPRSMWVKFSIPEDMWASGSADDGLLGVNNLNTLPLSNLPYSSINSIGKQWIRRFALSLCKEVLGQVRSKFSTIPVPGDSLTLNGGELISQAREEQDKLRDELKDTLAELTYAKLAEIDSIKQESAAKVLEKVPNLIFVG